MEPLEHRYFHSSPKLLSPPFFLSVADQMAESLSPMGSAYAFSKPKTQAVEVSNSSYVLQFASRRFLDNLLQADESGRRYRQLQDAEFNDNDPNGLQELMDVLPNIDLTDVMEIPKVFQCDEQTLPCDHTTKFRTMTGCKTTQIL